MNVQYVKASFGACKDPLEKQQLCYILARQVTFCPPHVQCLYTRRTWSVFYVNWNCIFCKLTIRILLCVQGVSLEIDEEITDNEEQRELQQELISNSKLSEGYLTLARDLDVMEPKTPDDIYKVGLRLFMFAFDFVSFPCSPSIDYLLCMPQEHFNGGRRRGWEVLKLVF